MDITRHNLKSIDHNIREHSSLNYQTPFSCLKRQLPHINDKIRFVIPIMLDKVSVTLGPWSGYQILAEHLGTTQILKTPLNSAKLTREETDWKRN